MSKPWMEMTMRQKRKYTEALKQLFGTGNSLNGREAKIYDRSEKKSKEGRPAPSKTSGNA